MTTAVAMGAPALLREGLGRHGVSLLGPAATPRGAAGTPCRDT